MGQNLSQLMLHYLLNQLELEELWLLHWRADLPSCPA